MQKHVHVDTLFQRLHFTQAFALIGALVSHFPGRKQWVMWWKVTISIVWTWDCYSTTLQREILHFLQHYICWIALLSTNFADSFSYMISSKHIMQFSAEKKKKSLPLLWSLKSGALRGLCSITFAKSASEEEIFQLGFVHKSEWGSALSHFWCCSLCYSFLVHDTTIRVFSKVFY